MKTNKKNSEELIAIVEKLSNILEIDKNNILVGGSLSLFISGFPIEGYINDLDIEIEFSKNMFEKLSLIQKTTNSKRNSVEYYGDFDKTPRFDIIIDGFKVNVWLPKQLSEMFVYKDYVKYKAPMEVLKYKLGYARVKDIQYYKLLISKLTSMLGANNLKYYQL